MNELMKTIADNNLEDINKEDILDTTETQIKLFLLAEAKSNLKRICKLTSFLNKVEDKFEENVTELMDMNALSLESYSDIIGTITSCLARSSDIVNRVIKDDTLTNLIFVNQTNNKTNNTTINSTNVGAILKSSDSRDRVNKAIQQVLGMIDKNVEELNEVENNE